MRFSTLLLICLVCFVQTAFTQNTNTDNVQLTDSIPKKDSTTAANKRSFFDRLLNNRQNKVKNNGTRVTYFVLPGYSPDIKLSIAFGSIISLRTNRNDSLLPISSFPITISYSTNKSLVASSGIQTFWLHDKLRVYGFLQYRSSRDLYYGVGYDNAINTPYPDSVLSKRSFLIFYSKTYLAYKKKDFMQD